MVVAAVILVGFLPLAKAKSNGNNQQIVGSIIRTSDPTPVLSSLKGKGVRVALVDRPKHAKTIISVRELPNSSKMQELAKRPGVEVLPNYSYKLTAGPNDTEYPEQWNLPKISIAGAWNITKGTDATTIAIIDSGVLSSQVINAVTYSQTDFPDEKIWKNIEEIGSTTNEGGAPNCTSRSLTLDKSCNNLDDDGNGKIDDWRGWDFMAGWRGNNAGCPNYSDSATYESVDYPGYIEQDNDPQPYSCDNYLPGKTSLLNKDHYSGGCSYDLGACYIGHGTMAASVAAATTDNTALIAGIDQAAKIMNLRVFDGYGITDTAHVAAAVNYAVAENTDVINMSLSVSDCSNNNFTDPTLETALKSAADAKIVSVAASGNGGQTSTICYPASSQYVIAAGATNQNDVRQSYSDGSSKLDVVAPSGIPVANAPSAYLDTDYYASAHGTSFSSPGVAGLAGLLKATNPGLSASAVRNYIRGGADKVAGMNGQTFTNTYGYGRVNAFNSLRLATGNNIYPYAWSIVSNTVAANPSYTQSFTDTFTLAPDEKLYIKIRALNNGYYTWQNSWARIGTQDPQDRTSVFFDDSWASSGRLSNLNETSVLPEQKGTFEFALKAPSIAGSYSESFGGLAEGRSWFQGSHLKYPIDVVEPVSASNSQNISLASGQLLTSGNFLLSPDRHSILKLQFDGNLVLYRNLKPVWHTRTNGTKANKLAMQGDGNLVLYDSSNRVLWHSHTYGNVGAYVTTQTDGNLVVYNSSDVPLWSTNSVHYPNNLRVVDKLMKPRYVLHAGQKIETANRKYRLVFQSDGNIVLYNNVSGKAIWASRTVGKNPDRLVFQTDGNVVLYSASGKALWNTRTAHKGSAALILQQDGNLVLYASNGRPLWNTETSGQ